MADDPAAQDDDDALPNEHWLQTTWRPAMAWSYFLICLCDFIAFPALYAAFYAGHDLAFQEWHPLTLQGGGLYHIAMGAIVSVTSWQRTREKMARYDMGQH